MTERSSKYSQRFKHGIHSTLSRKSSSWAFGSADLVSRTGLGTEEISVNMQHHLLLLNLRGSVERGGHRIDGRTTSFRPRKPGDLLFLPAGCYWQAWEDGAPSGAYLSVTIEPEYVDRLCSDHPGYDMPSFSPDLGFEDPIVLNAAKGIGLEMSERGPVSTILCESYVATIFAQLMRRSHQRPTPHKGGLSPRHMIRVMELIDADLTRDFSLSDLAGVVGLSVPHFCRAFKETVGLPPYTFVLQRRIEEAKTMLAQTSVSITEIALACGFSSSSHLSNMFKRQVGISPLAYRQNWPGRIGA